MRSTAQIEASRTNGAKSQGPKTPEGKAVSSQNARRYDFYSKVVLLVCEDAGLHAEHSQSFHETWQPVGAQELALVEELIHAHWRLRRVWAHEAESLNRKIDAIEDSGKFPMDAPQFAPLAAAMDQLANEERVANSIHRAETRYHRIIDRTTKLLMQLQDRRRKLQAELPVQNEPEIAPEPAPEPENQILQNEPEPAPEPQPETHNKNMQNEPSEDFLSLIERLTAELHALEGRQPAPPDADKSPTGASSPLCS